MSDAFNNYCLTCDQLCGSTSVYCSEECKEHDQLHAHNEMVSPLLTPSYSMSQTSEPSPLMGYSLAPVAEPVDDFDLYTVSLDSFNTTPTSVDSGASAVSDNYRKWLHALY
ncbi:hypothetical protein DIURU_001591 [Diutina rugosa]|uniref:Uncharacterized protein n=1 Tax=Diutina rugosa TaxID=5481 RepID=A0A642UTJ0_DIURU|nr:uncharacterized protein DIURU_001591 [Diutina rugosa]KAA8905163.1 hypothetical protein DIURU_001591 [Diutina rugosa]